MAGFWGGLANAATAGLVAVDEQQANNRRALLLEKARQDALARQAKQVQLAQDTLDEKREHDRLTQMRQGIVRGQTNITAVPGVDTPAPAPMFDPSKLNAGSDVPIPAEGANLTPGATSPVGDGLTPRKITLPKIPTLNVEKTDDYYDPTKDANVLERQATQQAGTARALLLQKNQQDAQAERDRRRRADNEERDNRNHGFRLEEKRTPAGGVSAEAAGSQKDLTNTTHEQVRAERQAAAVRASLLQSLKGATSAQDSSRVRAAAAPAMTQANQRVQDLNARADSIMRVIPTQRAGTPSPAAPSTPPAAPHNLPDGKGDYAQAATKYQQAIDMGIDPTAARAAYDATVALIAKKLGHTK